MYIRSGQSSRIWRIIRTQQLRRARRYPIRYFSNEKDGKDKEKSEDRKQTWKVLEWGSKFVEKVKKATSDFGIDTSNSFVHKVMTGTSTSEHDESSNQDKFKETADDARSTKPSAKVSDSIGKPHLDSSTAQAKSWDRDTEDIQKDALSKEGEDMQELLQKTEAKIKTDPPTPELSISTQKKDEDTPGIPSDNMLDMLEMASAGIKPEPPKPVLPASLMFLGEYFNTSEENLYNSINDFTRRRVLSGDIPPVYQIVTDEDVPVEDQKHLISLLEASPNLTLSARPALGEDASNTNWLFSKYLELGEFPSGDVCAQQLGCTTTAALNWRRAKIDRLIEIIPTSNYADGGTGADRAAERHDPNRFQKENRNFFNRVGDHSPSWKPGETDARKDPFDSYLHPYGDRNGGAPNLQTVDPKSFYGYANYLGDEIESFGRPIKVVPSEHGKFRMFLTDPPSGNEGVLDISTCEELKNNHFIYDRDRKTYVLGLCSRSRLEFFKSFDYKGLWNSRVAQLDDYPLEYFKVLYKTAHAFSYSRKPMMVLMCGDMSGPSAGLALHCGARLMDAGTRLRFDHAKRGSFFEMGAFHRLALSRMPYRLALYYALTGHPIPAWEMIYYGLGDWMVPDQNGPVLFHYMGEQIDSTFLDVFKDQDKFRHRAMLRSVIELFDRGQEHYAHNTWRKDKASIVEGEDKSIEDEMKVVFEKPKIDDPITGMKRIVDELEKRAGTQFWAREALESIRDASPISLIATYKLFSSKFALVDRTLEEVMHVELGVLKWMQDKGDFWEGVRGQVHQGDSPKLLWRHENFDDLWTDEDYKELCSPSSKWLVEREKAGKEVLELAKIPKQESLFYPRAAPRGMTWENTKFANDEVEDKIKHLYDYTQLRGPVHPDVQSKLVAKYYRDHWRNIPISARSYKDT